MYTETERKERMKLICRMYEAGDSTTKIGREIGVSHQTVRNWLKADGIKLKGPRNGNKLPCDVGKLKELAAKGLTKQEIGDQMHVSRSTVGVWLYETGTRINTEARKDRQQQERKKQEPEPLPPKPEKKCKTCRYRSGSSDYGCNYCMIKKKSRGCQIIGCERYEKGKRIRLKEEYIRV